MMYTKKDIQGFFISVGLMHDRAITEIILEPIHLYDDTYVSGFKNVISKRQILVHLTKYKKISLDNIMSLFGLTLTYCRRAYSARHIPSSMRNSTRKKNSALSR